MCDGPINTVEKTSASQNTKNMLARRTYQKRSAKWEQVQRDFVANKLRTRSICFTANNWTEATMDYIAQVNTERSTELVVAYEEVGEECGTPHLQGFMVFTEAVKFRTLKRTADGQMYFEAMCAPVWFSFKYCKKDGNLKYSFGDIKKIKKPAQGERTDLQRLKDKCKAGLTMECVIEDGSATNIQHINLYEKLSRRFEPERDFKPMVIDLHGISGSGKSTVARMLAHMLDMGETIYEWGPQQLNWFDGYDAHQYMILDDIRPSNMSGAMLLNMTGHTACRLQVKGGMRQILAKVIIVTSLKGIREMYGEHDESEDVYQFTRRTSGRVKLLTRPSVENWRDDLMCTAESIIEYIRSNDLWNFETKNPTGKKTSTRINVMNGYYTKTEEPDF